MTSASLSGRNILVVVDEYRVAMSLVDELENAGVHVIGPAPTVGKGTGLVESGVTNRLRASRPEPRR